MIYPCRLFFHHVCCKLCMTYFSDEGRDYSILTVQWPRFKLSTNNFLKDKISPVKHFFSHSRRCFTRMKLRCLHYVRENTITTLTFNVLHLIHHQMCLWTFSVCHPTVQKDLIPDQHLRITIHWWRCMLPLCLCSHPVVTVVISHRTIPT